MHRNRALLCALLVALSVAGTTPATAQEDLVTLTVSVETDGGDPVRGATLTAEWDGGSSSETTKSNGKALLDVPDGADVEISVDHDDYVRNFPVVVEGADGGEVTVTVYRTSSVRVLVEDGDGPIRNAEVTLRKGSRDVAEGTTDDDGVMESGTIEAGTYSVSVSKAGYFVARERLDVDGDTEATVPLRRGTVTLEVNVTDDHFDPNRPVGGATVAVEGSGSVTTQPAGVGRISVPVNAWAHIEVTKDGYRTAEESEFVAEEDATVDLTIQRTPSISVDLLSKRVLVGESVSLTVTDEYGDPVEGATVRVDGEDVAETNANGGAVLQVQSAGNHTVTVEAESLEATAYVEGVREGQGTVDATETTTATTETAAETPGFGAGAALVALALATLAGLARRRGRA